MTKQWVRMQYAPLRLECFLHSSNALCAVVGCRVLFISTLTFLQQILVFQFVLLSEFIKELKHGLISVCAGKNSVCTNGDFFIPLHSECLHLHPLLVYSIKLFSLSRYWVCEFSILRPSFWVWNDSSFTNDSAWPISVVVVRSEVSIPVKFLHECVVRMRYL